MRTFLIALLIAPCWLLVGPNLVAQWGTIRGHVLEGKRPVPGAVVELQGSCQGAYSDSMGFFSFSNLPFGKYHIQISSPNRYAPVTTVELREAESPELMIVLRRDVCDPLSAQLDIEAGSPLLLIVEGIQGFPNTRWDEIFEHTYKVKYELYGCTGPTEQCVDNYNQVIIKFLDKKYGSTWRDQVRTDFRSRYLE